MKAREMDVLARIEARAAEAVGYIRAGGAATGHVEIAMRKLASEVIEACAKIAANTSGFVSANESYERGYDAGRADAAEAIRKLMHSE